MIRMALVVGIMLVTTGCATHHQANMAAGGVTGGIIGHAIGGSHGAVVGAAIGTAIGGSVPAAPYPPAYGYHGPVLPPYYRHYSPVYPDYRPCTQWHYQEREQCYRGAEARARDEQARRNREAYNAGRYGR